MRHVARYEDKVAGAGLRDELKSRAPPHPRMTLYDVDDALQFAVVMRADLGVRRDADSAGLELAWDVPAGDVCGVFALS